MTPEKQELKELMLRRCRKTIKDLEQSIVDAASWNDYHPTETPMDIERERVAVSLLREFEKELAANQGERLDVENKMARVIETLRSKN